MWEFQNLGEAGRDGAQGPDAAGQRVAGPLDEGAELWREVEHGRSNTAIGERLVLSAKTVETHIGRLFAKFDLPPVADDSRRVLAVLTHLGSRAVE